MERVGGILLSCIMFSTKYTQYFSADAFSADADCNRDERNDKLHVREKLNIPANNVVNLVSAHTLFLP